MVQEFEQKTKRKFFKSLGWSEHLNHTTGGMGLGLSISKNIIEHGGGSLWVESAEGQGASFLFTIPREKWYNPCNGNKKIWKKN